MNRKAHAMGSGLALTAVAYHDSGVFRPSAATYKDRLALAATAGGFGAMCGSLPDLLEPAIHPNHRQFFHSTTAKSLPLVGKL